LISHLRNTGQVYWKETAK